MAGSRRFDINGAALEYHEEGAGEAIVFVHGAPSDYRVWLPHCREGADRFIASMLGLALGAPGYSIGEINDWLEGQQLSAEKLIPQTFAIDADELGGEFALPVLVIQGEEDFTTPTSLARSLRIMRIRAHM